MTAATVGPPDLFELVSALGRILALEDLMCDPSAVAPSERSWAEFLALQRPEARDLFERSYAQHLEQMRRQVA
jgi:hypothetical protein